MKILRMEAASLLRLEVVEIAPQGNLITVTGKNGMGKSSVLNAITMALGGGEGIPWEPVKRGAESGHVTLDLGDEKLELRVTRRFHAKDGEAGSKPYTTSLTIEDADGRRPRKPQELLDSIVGAIAFDPLEWARMPDKEKVATLRKLVSGVDFDAIADRRAKAYEERTVQNRRAHEFKTRASGIIVPPNAPDQPVDTKALTDKLASAGDQVASVERERHAQEAEQSRANEADRLAKEATERAADLRARADIAEVSAIEQTRRAAAIRAAQDDLPPLPDPPDIQAIRAELDMAGELNAAYAKAQQRHETDTQAKIALAESEKLTAEIEACDTEVSDAITAADLPVRGLTFNDEGVYLDDLPFEQAADSKKLRASIAIAIAQSPTLRVMCIKDGSLLDTDAMKVLAEVAEAEGHQVWIERVQDDSPAAIEMVDGMVAKK